MQIEIHGFTVVMHGMKDNDVTELCSVLHIDFDLFIKNEVDIHKTFVHAFGKGKESVYIVTKNLGRENSYARLTLHGSFFDNSPDFKLRKLLNFTSRFESTPIQLDVAFNDDKNCLSLKNIRHWFAHDDEYCKGPLVRTAPREVTCRGEFERIQLGSARSRTYYGTIYIRPDTGFIRFEVKFKNKNKIRYLLENYNDKNPVQFENNSRQLLVNCIDILTPQTKKNKNLKDKKQPSWKAFLGSDIKRMKLSKIFKEKFNKRVAADKETVVKNVSRIGAGVRNTVDRCSTIVSKDEIYKQFAIVSGYMLENIDGD